MAIASKTMTLVLLIFLPLLLVSVIAIVVMLVSLSRRGDERRRMIIEKTSARTFLFMVSILCFSVLIGFIPAAMGRGAIWPNLNPLALLALLSVIYAVHLAYFGRKYGA